MDCNQCSELWYYNKTVCPSSWKIVSIQGELHTHHSGTIFTLPNTIDPPKYKIGYSHNKGRGNWHCTIQGGQRNCVVDYCNNGCSEYIGFLMTYII